MQLTGLCGLSLAALSAYVNGLGPFSGPPWTVQGCSRSLCGRSWATLGASVGGIGLLSGPLWAILGRVRALWEPSEGDLGPEVVLARAGRRSGKRI